MADSSRKHGRPTVRYESAHGEAWFLGDQRRRRNKSAEMVVHVGDLAHCSATDLQRVMRRAVQDTGYGETVLVSEVDEAYFDEDGGLVSPVSFELDDDALELAISFFLDDYDEDLQPRLVAQALAPLLRRHRMTLLGAWPDEHYAASPWLWHARFGFNTRGRTLAALFQVGQDALALMQAMAGGQLTRATVGDLVRGGHARVLIGQPEGHWLDVKSQHYDLSAPHGQISLAQAVTRFCNAEVGGLVVLGMSTKKVPGGEEIRALCPVRQDNKVVLRYQQALEKARTHIDSTQYSRIGSKRGDQSSVDDEIGAGDIAGAVAGQQQDEISDLLWSGEPAGHRVAGGLLGDSVRGATGGARDGRGDAVVG
jgi:hypothetical protein